MSIIENIFNPNDHFTWGNAFNNTYRGNNSGSPSIKQGVIVNVSRQNHLAQTYDVEELESGALLTGCKYLSPTGGFNGTGNFSPLEEGTPVTLGCANGMWDEVFITGVFFTEGNYDSYYQEGKLQKPGDTENNLEFNQVSGHPNRIVDPTAQINIYGNKNLTGGFASPEFATDLTNKALTNPVPGAIELKTTFGDSVRYSSNTDIIYANNVLTVSSGTNETKCNKLLEIANMYTAWADLLEGTTQVIETPKQQAQSTTGIKPIVTISSPANNNSTLRSPFEQSYFIEQYRKLAQLHLQQAKNCNGLDAARQNVVNQMENNLGSELPSTTNPTATEGKVTKPSYKPKESKSAVDSNNFGDRIPNKFKPLIVLHETIGNAASVISLFQNPKAEVSYHVMIKLTGELVYFTDSKKRAYGASPSQFNGEFETRTRTDGKTVKSVNSFAYHISFETPLNGQGSNSDKATHSGYTEAQYMSAAYHISKCGVPLSRIATHKGIDIGQGKIDPRSFDRAKFEKLFKKFPITKEIWFDIYGEDFYVRALNNNQLPGEAIDIATPINKFIKDNLIEEPVHKSTLDIYKARYSKAFNSQYTKGKPAYGDWIALFRKEASLNNTKANRIKNVIVGDSITLGYPSELLGDRVLNQGISGESSIGLLKRVDTIIAAAPTKVFIMIGINDLLNERTVQSIIPNVEATVAKIKAFYPNTKIYIQSTLPKAVSDEVAAVNKAYKDKILNTQNRDVRELNAYFKANQRGFTYLDIASQMENSKEGLNKYFTTDGVHLSYTGYKVWANIIKGLLD